MRTSHTQRFCTLFGVGTATVLVAAMAVAASPLAKHGQGPSGRKSTAPPVPAKGKMGQDLFLALDHHDLEGLKALVAKGADVNARNGLEFTPLYMAAASHQTDAMQVLLDHGAELDARSPYGTALMFAAASANVPGAELLIARGADVNAKRSDGMTVLMMAVDSGVPPFVADLLKRKADVRARDTDDSTALNVAARVGHAAVADMLIRSGAPIDHADAEGQTPLMLAAANGHSDVVGVLLKLGAKVDARDTQKRTALILAADYGDSPQVVRALLGAGANPKAKDASGCTAADFASARGHAASLALLGSPNPKAIGVLTPRLATRSGLKALEASMREFHDVTSCVSCHHEGLGRIATGFAQGHGFSLDQQVEKNEMEAVNAVMNGMRSLHEQALKNPEAMKQVPLIEINEVASSDTWLLCGMAAQHQPATAGTTAMALVLARQQAPDGHWGFSGPRAPMQSSFFTFTALSVQALNTYAPRSQEISNQVAMARDWLSKTPVTNSEDRAFRLLGLKWASGGPSARRQAIADIIVDQQPDGGWSQLPGGKSDAYATGQALFALCEAGGLPTSDPVYKLGSRFLLRTQDSDGTWFVNKRASPNNNYLDAGFPHGESQYASFNGTCWATMALAEAAGHG